MLTAKRRSPWSDGIALAISFSGLAVDAKQVQDDRHYAKWSAVQVLFIVDVEQNGRWEWQSVDVSYLYLGETYADNITNGLILCAPETGSCER